MKRRTKLIGSLILAYWLGWREAMSDVCLTYGTPQSAQSRAYGRGREHFHRITLRWFD